MYYRLLTTKKGYEPQDNVADRVRKITEHTCDVEGDWQEVSLNDRRLKYKVSCGIFTSPIVFAHLFGFNPHLPPQFSILLFLPLFAGLGLGDTLSVCLQMSLLEPSGSGCLQVLQARCHTEWPRQCPPRLDS